MSPTPDKTTLRATLQLCIDLPSNYEEFSADQQRTVRRAFKHAIARHPGETDDSVGTALGKLQRGVHPTVSSPAWIDAELVAKNGYPSQAELRAFVATRLAGYNAAIREPRDEGNVELAPEADPPASGASAGSTAHTSTAAPPTSGAPNPGTVSGPHDGPGGPRTVRYRIVNGELYCFYGYWMLVKDFPGSGPGDPPPRPYELHVDAGQALALPIYAEVGFTRA